MISFNKKISKDNVIIFVIFLIIFLCFCYFSGENLNGYSLIDILTFLLLTILSYHIGSIKEKKKDKNLIVEKTVEDIQMKCLQITELVPKYENYTKFLYSFKYISNKIDILNKLLPKEQVSGLEKAFSSLRLIGEEINFSTLSKDELDILKNKIANAVVIMESSLGKIIISIYVD